jgi:hypothetical protein
MQMNTKASEELLLLHNASNECMSDTPNLSVTLH